MVFQLSGLLSTLLKATRQAADCDEWDALVAGGLHGCCCCCFICVHLLQHFARESWLSIPHATDCYLQAPQTSCYSATPGTAVGELVEVETIEEADLSNADKEVIVTCIPSWCCCAH